MEHLETDILIVGAGPAGSSAALSARREGLRVLLVERKKSIGYPVQCAEFIPVPLIGNLGIGSSFCVQKIKGMKTYIRQSLAKETRAPGFIINREKFDRLLAQKAVDTGVRLMTSTRAASLEDGSRVLLKNNTGSLIVDAKVIIGADGPTSRVRKWTDLPENELLPGVQNTFQLTKKLQHTRIFFAPEFFGGYAWLFPKGDTANVGLGVKTGSNTSPSPLSLLAGFADSLKKQGLISGSPLAKQAGWIPFNPPEKAVFNRILLVGDAAGHTHPITGAGIFSAVTCGEMAGKWAAESILNNDVSILKEYDREWKEMFSRTLYHAYRRRVELESQWQIFDQAIRSGWVAFGEYYE